MAAPYNIWIRGVSGTHFDSTDGKVTTGASDAAPSVIGEPSVPNGWQLVPVYFMNPTFLPQGESKPTIDGKKVRTGEGRWTFEFQAQAFDFDTEFSAYKSLMQHLSRDEVYIHLNDYEHGLHLTGQCLATITVATVEHKHKNGLKIVKATLELRDEGEVL